MSHTFQRRLLKLGDINAPVAGGQGVHIATESAIVSRGNSKAVVEHQLVKQARDNRLALNIGKISRERCYKLFTTAGREKWWSRVSF